MKEYEEYLDRYCAKTGVSREKAEELAIVKDIKAYYEQQERESKQIIKDEK